jgi:hypothetical protein
LEKIELFLRGGLDDPNQHEIVGQFQFLVRVWKNAFGERCSHLLVSTYRNKEGRNRAVADR